MKNFVVPNFEATCNSQSLTTQHLKGTLVNQETVKQLWYDDAHAGKALGALEYRVVNICASCIQNSLSGNQIDGIHCEGISQISGNLSSLIMLCDPKGYINTKVKTNYAQAIKSLYENAKQMVKEECGSNGQYSIVAHSWVSGVEADTEKDTFLINFNPTVMELMFGMGGNVLFRPSAPLNKFNSKYTSRLYELLFGYLKSTKEISFRLSFIAKRIDATKQAAKPSEFKRSVLEPAMEEINKYGEGIMRISCEIFKSEKKWMVRFFLEDLSQSESKIVEALPSGSRESIEAEVKRQIGYDNILQDMDDGKMPDLRKILQQIVATMVSVYAADKSEYKSNGKLLSQQQMVNIYRKLQEEHIRVQLDNLVKSNKPITPGKEIPFFTTALTNLLSQVELAKARKDYKETEEASVEGECKFGLGRHELAAIRRLMNEE